MHQMYTLGVIELFSMIIFCFLQVSFSSRPLPLFTISLLFKIVIQVRYPPSFSAEFTKSSVFFWKASLTRIILNFLHLNISIQLVLAPGITYMIHVSHDHEDVYLHMFGLRDNDGHWS